MTDGAQRDTIRPAGPEPTRILRVRPGTEGVTEFLGFRVANESYGLPLSSVREILKSPPITEVPRAAHDVLGIVSVRGRITTVYDVRVRLGLRRTPSSRHSRILLVDSGQEVIGLMVDAVLQVYRLMENEVEPAVAVGADMAEYVIGIGRPRLARAVTKEGDTGQRRDDDEILILLDPKTFFKR